MVTATFRPSDATKASATTDAGPANGPRDDGADDVADHGSGVGAGDGSAVDDPAAVATTEVETADAKDVETEDAKAGQRKSPDAKSTDAKDPKAKSADAKSADAKGADAGGAEVAVADAQTSVDDATDGNVDSTRTDVAGDTSAPTDAPDTERTGTKQVTVVPGVPRYHTANCILIRFMGDDDMQKMTLPDATAAGCTPCRACHPD